MNNEWLYRIALTRIPGIGDIHARSLLNQFGQASDIFKAPQRILEKISGIGKMRAREIRKFNQMDACEKELRFITDKRITPLFISDKQYPRRLSHCYDAPVLLYFLGNADLNSNRIVSVVGTRNQNDYGKQICESLIAGLRSSSVMVISGLAFGIDTTTHKACLKNDIPTVAALAHGLDRIYPGQNRGLAAEMIRQGGLLTDFPTGTNPDKQNFPKRNRIVAGLCDCLVVIQSGLSGGSIITAELANEYNRDVFAFPGRIDDSKSDGCHALIRQYKADLITSHLDLLEKMNWLPETRKEKKAGQRSLFPELPANEKMIADLLSAKDMHIDEIQSSTGLSSSSLAAAMLFLEMNSLVIALPGRIFRAIP
jgi:DNA processing protein